MTAMSFEPVPATRRDFAEIIGSLNEFWGDRDVRHLHHPTMIDEFGDAALVMHDQQGRVVAYLFGMFVSAKRRGYVHVVAVRENLRGRGAGRRLYETFATLASAHGCTTIKAITTPTNAGSIAFHRSLGMRSEEIAAYAGPGQTRIVFTRDLPARAAAANPSSTARSVPEPSIFLRNTMAFTPPSKGDQTRRLLHLSPALTATRANVWLMPPGSRGRRHREVEQEELFVALEGTATVLLGEPAERFDFDAGSVVVVPAGTPVQLVNDHDHNSLVLIVGAPPSPQPAEYLPDVRPSRPISD
jgi:ribosomal protein S18 acetylase RimI-like enzyme/mannose-6-phosphate isomerase-like protein (cupin superfamily)